MVRLEPFGVVDSRAESLIVVLVSNCFLWLRGLFDFFLRSVLFSGLLSVLELLDGLELLLFRSFSFACIALYR